MRTASPPFSTVRCDLAVVGESKAFRFPSSARADAHLRGADTLSLKVWANIGSAKEQEGAARLWEITA